MGLVSQPKSDKLGHPTSSLSIYQYNLRCGSSVPTISTGGTGCKVLVESPYAWKGKSKHTMPQITLCFVNNNKLRYQFVCSTCHFSTSNMNIIINILWNSLEFACTRLWKNVVSKPWIKPKKGREPKGACEWNLIPGIRVLY
jgi:hypothetical protein